MKVEKIQRSDGSFYEHLIADEGMKLINKSYMDKTTDGYTIVCGEVYLCDTASSSEWVEITEDEAAAYQKNYEEQKIQRN